MLLAAACISFLFLPSFDFAASANDTVKATPLFKDSVFNTYDSLLLQIIVISLAVFVFINIFLFKNRKLQLLIIKILMLTVFALIVAGGIIFYHNFENRQDEITNIQVRLGLFIPFITLILLYFAGNYIKRDISIVKSMDRLR